MSKRRRYREPIERRPPPGAVSFYALETAKLAHEAIQNLVLPNLWEPGKISTLPYPGIGDPPGRPGGTIEYVGTADCFRFLRFAHDNVPEIYLIGCKGIGKSCLLRAVACYYIKRSNDVSSNTRIVCIWNMERAFGDLTSALRDALTFTYCLDNDVVSSLRQIADLEGLKAFISQRKEQGESFLFIIDGVQYLDEYDSSGLQRSDWDSRRCCKAELLAVTQLAAQCILGLSPEAADAVEAKRTERDNNFTMRSGFDEESFQAFVPLTGVCDGFSSREEDVYFLAGAHPMSIARLSKCITDYVRELDQDEGGQVSESQACSGDENWPGWRPPPEDVLTKEEVSQRFSDDSDWRIVKKRYVEEMMRIKPGILRLVQRRLEKDCTTKLYFSVEEMMSVDPRYVVAGKGDEPPEFCTRLIHTIYVQAFGEATHGPWLDYCKYLLENPRGVVWPDVGWLCHAVVGDLLGSELGLQLGDLHLQKLRMLSFTEVPTSSEWMPLLAHECEGQSGVSCLPSNCWYPHADAVVIWRRKVNGSDWEYHLQALQFTVNYSSHLESARAFMDLSWMQEWIPDILEKRGAWKLHYTFVACEDVQAKQVPAELKRCKGSVFGSLGYELEVCSFESVVRHFSDGKAAETLQAIVNKRSAEVAAPFNGPVSLQPFVLA